LNPERALRALALVAALWLAPAPAKAAATFDSPTGLTLLAQGGGRYLMLWDPIYRDDLLGYSVWLRKPGDAEFMRLSVPVKVGKEVKKQPMTPDAKVVLALGHDRSDLELTVVAEYEDGSSARAPVARSAAAHRSAAALAAAAPEGGAPPADSPTATVRERSDALAHEEAPVPAGETPWDKDKDREPRPLILPAGKWSTSVGAGFDFDRFITSGTYSVTYSAQAQTWQETDVRTALVVPLTLRLGLLPGLEAWARAEYRAEDYYTASYVLNSVDYDYVRFVTQGPNGSLAYESNPTTSGLGDIHVGLRAQPWDGQPLVLGLEASLPTGVSRFKSMLDFYNGVGTAAGNGDGVLRLRLAADWGQAGLQSGLSFHASYMPSATETYTLPYLGTTWVVPQSAVLGAAVELGGAYTFPWQVVGRQGALALGVTGSSVEADRWTVDGFDMGGYFSGSNLGEIAALGGLEFKRDDRLELSLIACQDLPRGFETRGKLAYTMDALGDQLSLSGQFLY